MLSTWACFPVVVTLSALAFPGPASAQTEPVCDRLGGEGWSMVLTHETVAVSDGAPYRNGDDWFVERATTTLPLCNYINAAGHYSLLSYSLSPETKTERVAICKGATPVTPYTGPCPPR